MCTASFGATSSSGSSGRVRGGGRETWNLYAAAFGSHPFYDLFSQDRGGHGPLGPPWIRYWPGEKHKGCTKKQLMRSKSLTAWNPFHGAEHSSSECSHSIESLKRDQIPTWFTKDNHLRSCIRYSNALPAVIIFIITSRVSLKLETFEFSRKYTKLAMLSYLSWFRSEEQNNFSTMLPGDRTQDLLWSTLVPTWQR